MLRLLMSGGGKLQQTFSAQTIGIFMWTLRSFAVSLSLSLGGGGL